MLLEYGRGEQSRRGRSRGGDGRVVAWGGFVGEFWDIA